MKDIIQDITEAVYVSKIAFYCWTYGATDLMVKAKFNDKGEGFYQIRIRGLTRKEFDEMEQQIDKELGY